MRAGATLRAASCLLGLTEPSMQAGLEPPTFSLYGILGQRGPGRRGAPDTGACALGSCLPGDARKGMPPTAAQPSGVSVYISLASKGRRNP